MKRLMGVVNEYILTGLLFLLGLLIPLYPKLPLFDVSFTWTYIRLEDFIVAFVYLIFGVVIFVKRIDLRQTPLFWYVIVFWLVGLLSSLIAMLFLENGDGYVTYKPHLVWINYLRRIEYMGLFFLGAYCLSNLRMVKRFVIVTLVALSLVIFYGFGQMFWGFCSFLTMNEEFAKGSCLPLQVGGRVSSTFGGHYDLAGYLVLLLPIVAALIVAQKNFRNRVILSVILFAGFVLLLYTSSRISFAAILIAVGFVGVMLTKKKKMIFGALAVVILGTLVLGRDTIVQRLSDTIRIRQVTVDPTNGEVLPMPTTQKDWAGLPESDSAILLPFTPVEATDSAYRVYKYEKSEYERLRKMYPEMDITTVEIPNAQIRENSTEDKKEIIEEKRLVQGEFERRWALVFDISFTTRVQGGWPIAWRAFLQNPITGKGYSTVTAAVDSSYMRALGEVGILGLISFLAILIAFLRKSWDAAKRYGYRSFEGALLLGTSGGVTGLLVNATLIDIFEASKVAFVLWMVLGAMVALIKLQERDTGKNEPAKQ